MRYTFVETLTEEAEKNKDIILLTGDLGFTVFEKFRDKFPDRFINVGVAEQNMINIATGLALCGKIVFTYTIATFATMRPFEQIRQGIAAHKASVVIVGSGAGLSYGTASVTHHAVEDIHLMRALPGVTILCPSDPIETKWATKTAIKIKSPVYLRLGKKGEPNIYTKNPKLTLGKGSIVRNGKDIAIIATGNIVFNALECAKILSDKKIEATVVSMHTIKPMDKKIIEYLSNNFKFIVTIEEHSIIGGLGTAVAEVLLEKKNKARLKRIAIGDNFIFTIGSQNFLRDKLSLSPHKLARNILRFYKEEN